MARLYDKLLVANNVPHPFAGNLKGVTVFDIQNVSDYWFDVLPEKFTYRDFPNSMPPFDAMFLEYRRYGEQIGVLAELIEPEGVDSPELPFPWSSRASEVAHLLMLYPISVRGWRYWSDAALFVPLDENGAIPEGMGAAHVGQDQRLKTWGLPVLLAISFMHCKNVETREVEQPRFERQVWRKKHKRPLVRYHVLDIDPMRKVLRTEGRSDEVGLKKALHICRGHFAHYPQGLFGRGKPETVWRPQHIRGSKKEGLVLKDYNVKAPPK